MLLGRRTRERVIASLLVQRRDGTPVARRCACTTNGMATLCPSPLFRSRASRTAFGIPCCCWHAPPVPSAKRPVDSPSATTQRTVLLVDDDQRVRETVRMMLERAGHRVVEAESAEDAINQFNTMDSVDLLVSDLQMPGLSGLELFDRLVARLPSLRCCSSPEPPAPPTSGRSRAKERPC